MNKPMVLAATILLLTIHNGPSEPDELLEFDELMMRSTVKITSGNTVGTGFILLAPVAGNTNRFRSYVLVTATHVLSGMTSTNVSLSMRKLDQHNYQKLPHDIPIRSNGTNLWTSHPSADVAAMRIAIPNTSDVGKLPTEILREDDFLENFRIHPGDEVRVLVFRTDTKQITSASRF